MIKVKQAIIVEGKYDKIKLSSILDAIIIVTNGFHIFKDKEKMALIKYYAEKIGIIILTDADRAGFQIRNYIKGCIQKGEVYNVYTPDIYGKEKRKTKTSAEGKLGVEGIDKNLLLNAFEKAGILTTQNDNDDKLENKITKYDFYELGLSGLPESSVRRKTLQKYLDLPDLLSTSSLLEVLNTMMTKESLESTLIELFGE